MKSFPALAAVALAIAGCAAQPPTRSAAVTPTPVPVAKATLSVAPPSPSPSPEPPQLPSSLPDVGPLDGQYGIVATDPGVAATYTISVVGPSGTNTASVTASSPSAVTCDNAYSAVVPLPVSTSNSRVYYMDGQGFVWYLSASGSSGVVTKLPTGDGVRSMFAVSPDDRRIGVVVGTFSSNGQPFKDSSGHYLSRTRIYVEDLVGGTNHVEIFSDESVYTLWPVGWHGRSLVLAKWGACNAEGTICCGPLELHVIDPGTGVRLYTLGGASCHIAGTPSPAGVTCESNTSFQASVLDWTGKTVRTVDLPALQYPYAYAYLSPDGAKVAFNDGGHRSYLAGTALIWGAVVCGWIDSTHLIGISDTSAAVAVVDITANSVTDVAARGECAGRLPGAL